MEDETVLGGVTTGLEGTEESLLSTEDLDGGGGVLGEVDQASSVGDQTGSDDVSDERGKVGGDVAHLVVEVVVELLAVLVEVDDLEREAADVEHVEVRDVSSHGALGSLNDLLGLVLISEELGELGDLLLCDGGLLSPSLVRNPLLKEKKKKRWLFEEMCGEKILTREPRRLTIRAYTMLSGTTLMSSGKCQPYHSLFFFL